MTLLFFTFSLICTSASILFAFHLRHYFYFLVPFLFFLAFDFTMNTTNYIGYALDSRFVSDGSEALVLSLTETKEAYYVLVQFSDDDRPRLIRIAKVDGENDEIRDAGKANKVLRFGGDRSGVGQNGDEDEGHPGVRVIDLNKSEKFGKENS